MTKFNKDYQIKEVAEATGVSKSVVTNVYNALINVLQTGLKEEGKIILNKFGTFEKVHRNARTCRNPQTGEQMAVPECNAIKFRPVEALKKLINE